MPKNAFKKDGALLAFLCANTELSTKTIKIEKILYRNEFKQLVFHMPKTNSSYRTIKIGDTLVSLLKKYNINQKANKLRYGEFYVKHDYDFVCLKENGELLTTDSLKYLSRVVNYELHIPFKFYSLRHTHMNNSILRITLILFKFVIFFICYWFAPFIA